MARPATSRLKVNPPLGMMPALQYLLPAQLQVDASYQRSLDSRESQALIRKIAQHWNWDLCQPLVVARRDNGDLYVIDGQHRLEAARLRGDIAQLPAVVVQYASAADEAASFVHLNQQRRPLNAIDLFNASLASGDVETCAIRAALEAAGLSLAPHMNAAVWKPGMVGNVGGIIAAWRRRGGRVTGEALECLATAFAGQVLRYAGTIFPGIVAICAEECADGPFDAGRFATFTARLGQRGQERLRRDIVRLCAERADLTRPAAAARVIGDLWWPERAAARQAIEASKAAPAPAAAAERKLAFKGDEQGKAWCEQCEMRVTEQQASGCRSRWCSLRVVA